MITLISLALSLFSSSANVDPGFTQMCHFDISNPLGLEINVPNIGINNTEDVAYHLAHGDCIGSCDVFCPTRSYWLCHQGQAPDPLLIGPVGFSVFDGHMSNHNDCHMNVDDCTCSP